MTLRARLTFWYTATLALVLLVYSVALWAWLRERGLQDLNEKLEEDLRNVDDILLLNPDGSLGFNQHELDEDEVPWFTAHRADGSLLVESTHPRPDPSHARVRTRELGSHRVTVEVARPTRRLDRDLYELRTALGVTIPISLLLAAGGGWFLARRALARLERSFEQLRRFTADASHELRTPVTAMRLVGEVGLSRADNVEQLRETIGSMLEECDRLTRLVDDLLTLARADAGRFPIRRERFDLAALAREVVERLGVLAEEKQQPLEISAPRAVELAGDRILLGQALQNLLDNAIKQSPRSSPIRVAVQTTDARALVEIADHGPGIPPEHRARVFERFYRVDEARSRESGGVGLGLAIARFVVEAHGGSIDVVETPGGGATFRVSLPRGGDST